MPLSYSNTNVNINNPLIKRIIDDSYSHQDINEFINICSSISAAYLKNEIYYSRLYFPIVIENDNELKDTCLDLIAPLFARDKSNSFYIFKKGLLSKHNQLIEQSLYWRLKSIIISKTKQELIERFKKEEPSGYKILRNIKLAPARDNRLKDFNDQFNTYIYCCEEECSKPEIDYLNAELPEIDPDALLDLARNACKKYTMIPKILDYILISVKNENTYRDFIAISSLFKALKEILQPKTIYLDDVILHNEYSNNHNGHNGIDYSSNIYQELEDYIILTVKNKYQANDEINENEANYYKLVLKEYFKDMIFANNKTLPHYLNNGHNILTTNDIFTSHKSKIEYLIKTCKKELFRIISKY